jgi:2,3-bisphosphoglycerate-independent phosphoglycerate mutase
MALRDSSFYQNPALTNVCAYVKQKQSRLHLIGLFSESRTHSSLDHFEALLRLARGIGLQDVLVHAITDGKESLPQNAGKLLLKAEQIMSQVGLGRLASLGGRYYAMDSNEYWDRTQKYAEMLVSGSKICSTLTEALEKAYRRNLTDEFIEPCVLGNPADSCFQANDAVVFWNFREDGLRQLALCLSPLGSGVAPVQVALPPNVPVVCLVKYDNAISWPVAFAPPIIANTLCETLSQQGKRQLKLAESLKSQLVTYYFNGLRSEAFPNEYQIIVPSDKLLDLQKEYRLKTEALLGRFSTALEEQIYDFICLNLANLDVAGHQPNLELIKQVIQYIDSAVNRICRIVLANNATLLITSDHGNIEQMFDPFTGQPHTKHTDNPVPLWLVSKSDYGPRSTQDIALAEKEVHGGLADIAKIITGKIAET